MDNVLLDNQLNYMRGNANNKKNPNYQYNSHQMNDFHPNQFNYRNQTSNQPRRGGFNKNNNNNMSRSNSFGNNCNLSFDQNNSNNNINPNISRSMSFCNNQQNNNNRNQQRNSNRNNRNKKKNNYNRSNSFVNTNGEFDANNANLNLRFNNQYQSLNTYDLMSNSIVEDNELSGYEVNVTQTSYDFLTDSSIIEINSDLPLNNECPSTIIELKDLEFAQIQELPEDEIISDKLSSECTDEEQVVQLSVLNAIIEQTEVVEAQLVPTLEELNLVDDSKQEITLEEALEFNKFIESNNQFIETFETNDQYIDYSQTKMNDLYENCSEDETNKTYEDSGIEWRNNIEAIESSFESEHSIVNEPTVEITKNNEVLLLVNGLINELNLNKTTNDKPSLSGKSFQSDKFFKLVFAGDSAVGKTSFIMKYCKGEFSNATSATLGVDFYMKSLSIENTKDVQLQLWDTCGQERFRSIAKSYFRRADGVVLMYDVTCEQSFLNVREWIQSINDNSDRNIPIIIIGNKTDLREQSIRNNNKVIDFNDGYKFAKDNGALFVETSIKDGNIDETLVDLCKLMIKEQEASESNSGGASISLSLDGMRKKKLSDMKRRCC